MSGFYCKKGAQANSPVGQVVDGNVENDICPKGYYCPEGTVTPFPCPQGTFSNREKLEDQSKCELCPPGTGFLVA